MKRFVVLLITLLLVGVVGSGIGAWTLIADHVNIDHTVKKEGL